ncbi:unnamed protein product, partial [Brassica napus]
MSERGVACRRRTGEDMISLLPDHLLCQILSDVPTKTAVVTSVLSTRWRTIWLSTPVLDLHTDDFPNFTAFASFISWFLDFSKGSSCLHKLKLDLVSKRPIQEIFIESSWDLAFVRGYLDPYYLITDWINKAVTRKVQHLDISYPWIVEMMPLSIYTCETLVSLKLQNVPLADSQYVSLPLLNTMHLVENIYASDALLENLVSSCPVLEDLTVVRKGDTVYNFEVLRVRSQSLKSLVVVLSGREWWYKACRVAVIDAPGLNYLSLKDNKFTSYVISSLSSSAKVDIDVSFDVERSGQTTLIDSSKRSALRSFFSMLSSVRDMTISLTTLEGSSCLHKLKLDLRFGRPIQDISSELRNLEFVSRRYLDPSYLITQWINNAVKVQHLDILFLHPRIVDMMPLSIYTCVTLVSLKLCNVSLADTENISLPRLKIMHLVDNVYANDAFLEKLISSCPVLEDLTVVRHGETDYNLEVLRVHSKSLKSLVVDLDGNSFKYSDEDTGKAV